MCPQTESAPQNGSTGLNTLDKERDLYLHKWNMQPRQTLTSHINRLLVMVSKYHKLYQLVKEIYGIAYSLHSRLLRQCHATLSNTTFTSMQLFINPVVLN
ncbi:hypothetical protein GDO78_012731 [Eleutherodactylus coqui]|uniref:Uncharacterized protein n=1 Tax=Eleutherodactylus coqui TaxID=57060 RepID=A0A8J6K5A1_ELECQ|nr:hypothetical protein GDO78_012731 [Eleutherodactylus coqui]